eukprot:SAG31_NODE_42_length_31262_cov_46.416231_7_plen_241_part_00
MAMEVDQDSAPFPFGSDDELDNDAIISDGILFHLISSYFIFFHSSYFIHLISFILFHLIISYFLDNDDAIISDEDSENDEESGYAGASATLFSTNFPPLVYHMGSFLDKGANGKVFIATRDSDGQQVAVKMMTAPGPRNPRRSEKLRRLNRELDIGFNLQHPHLANWLDVIFTKDQQQVAIVMELANGGNARNLIAAGRMAEGDARHVFHQVLSGVEYLHAQSICHRDLKLENLVLGGPR